VSIRPGWFYHAAEDARVRTPANLVELYYSSVGRGASFLLNLAPDRRGRIPAQDVAALAGFRQILDATFKKNLARGAKVRASNVRGGSDSRFAAANVLDGSRASYWSTEDGIKTPELVLDFGREVSFNVVRIREFLPLGQRIESFVFDRWEGDRWTEFASGTSIGNCRLLRVTKLNTSRLRLRVTGAAACPAISEVSLFAEPN
jgi:alpha-L-fucosidase